VANCCEYGNEHSGYIKSRELLYQQINSRLFKKDSAPWRWSDDARSSEGLVTSTVCLIALALLTTKDDVS